MNATWRAIAGAYTADHLHIEDARTRVRAYEPRGFVLAAAAGALRIKFLYESGRSGRAPSD